MLFFRCYFGCAKGSLGDITTIARFVKIFGIPFRLVRSAMVFLRVHLEFECDDRNGLVSIEKLVFISKDQKAVLKRYKH